MAFGDHLVRQDPVSQHHGIDQGDGTVIEYGGKGTGKLSVRQISIDRFYGDGVRYMMQYPPGTTLPAAQTVELSRLRLAEQRYDLFNNNCEHLAFWCKTGRHMSPQADQLRSALQLVLLAVGVAAIAHAVEESSRPKRRRRSRARGSTRRRSRTT